MGLLSEVIIKAFEAELGVMTPEIENYMLRVLGTLGTELMAYVTQKVVQNNPPVITPQSVE